MAGATHLKSTVTVGGAANFYSTVTVVGAGTFKDDVSVSGNTVLGGTLRVAGATSLEGAVDLNSTLTVAGAVSLASTLSVGGAAHFASTVTVAGAAHLQAGASVTGDVIASGTFQPTGDTASGDDAAIGYTSGEGLILTGQGSTSDITLKNDADGTVASVPTGQAVLRFPDSAKATFGSSDDLQIYHDGSNSYIDDSGSGLLHIRGSQININKYTGENMATFVADGAATLMYDHGAKLATASGGVAVTGDLTATGTIEPAGDTASGDNAAIGYTSAEGLILTGQGSTNDVTIKNDADAEVCGVPTGTDDLRFPDNAKAEWGAGSDLQIYHDGTHSHIVESGSGQLYIKTNYLSITNAAGSETMTFFDDDGAVTLYYDNGAKIATTSTGVQVTGTILATTDTDTGNTGSVTLDFQANQNFILTLTGNLTLANPSTEQTGQSGIIVFIQDGTGSRTLSLGTDYETAAAGGITLSTAADAVDIVPYFVQSAGNILLGAVQKAFA